MFFAKTLLQKVGNQLYPENEEFVTGKQKSLTFDGWIALRRGCPAYFNFGNVS